MSPRKCICHTAHTTSSLPPLSHQKLFFRPRFVVRVWRAGTPVCHRLCPPLLVYSSRVLLLSPCKIRARALRSFPFRPPRLHQTVGQRKLGLRVSPERRWSVLGCSRARRSETAEPMGRGKGFEPRRRDRERSGRGNASALLQFPKISDGIAIGSRFWAHPLRSHPSSCHSPTPVLYFSFSAVSGVSTFGASEGSRRDGGVRVYGQTEDPSCHKVPTLLFLASPPSRACLQAALPLVMSVRAHLSNRGVSSVGVSDAAKRDVRAARAIAARIGIVAKMW